MVGGTTHWTCAALLAFFVRRSSAAFVDVGDDQATFEAHWLTSESTDMSSAKHGEAPLDAKLTQARENTTSTLELAYVEAEAMGLTRENARQMGVEWKVAGLPKNMIVGGVCTECDGSQFDSLATIESKARYACKSKLRGMMSWRIDNDNFEHNGVCAAGWPKPKGSGPTFKGVRRLKDAVNRHCGNSDPKPLLVAYVGSGINPDIHSDMWHSRGGLPLYKALPYDAADRICLAFVNIENCEVQPLPGWTGDMIRQIKEVNPKVEIYLTSSLGADQYREGGTGPFCTDSSSKTDLFLESLIKLLESHGLNGFDIDWENEIIKEKYMDLIKKVSARFKGTSYGLSMAVWPFYEPNLYDLNVLAEHVGVVTLMSYGGPRDTEYYFSELLKSWSGNRQ
eukprot:TRINITY_DN3048_c0_g1_i5.p1 TRINITY_DN3048_c0_g1~~TRINITY_DN3048_c0_g1_i5.p1  ORF type:complete len:429 (+),score=60.54 TRINITY_DN3048_c0_g1_i5:105-1289(+)